MSAPAPGSAPGSDHASRAVGRLRLRGLLERTELKGEEMEVHAGRFARLADPSSAVRVVSAFNLFQTPEPIAARLAGLVPLGSRVLEPSAGLGRLYRAVRNKSADCEIILVEQSADCCRELYREISTDDRARLLQRDFLTVTVDDIGGPVSAVVANPPFKMGTDIKHVRHMLGLLAPGGALVSLVANGPRQNAALRPLAEQSGGLWEVLPAGSFRSEGTGVSVAVCVILEGGG